MNSDQKRLLEKADELKSKMELYCQQEWHIASTPIWIALMVQLNDIIKILDYQIGEVK